jgi:hypothetical protein
MFATTTEIENVGNLYASRLSPVILGKVILSDRNLAALINDDLFPILAPTFTMKRRLRKSRYELCGMQFESDQYLTEVAEIRVELLENVLYTAHKAAEKYVNGARSDLARNLEDAVVAVFRAKDLAVSGLSKDTHWAIRRSDRC